jgi:hypothetical protein
MVEGEVPDASYSALKILITCGQIRVVEGQQGDIPEHKAD